MTLSPEITALGGDDHGAPMHVAGYAIDDRFVLPPKRDYGIGIIGCGGIVNYAHLPAYKAHGLNIRTCYDQDRSRAEKTARDHGIPTVADGLDELLKDDAIQILDIAVTPWAQTGVALRSIAAGKHLLCQKPLSNAYADAARVVEKARRAGVKVAVNQQMRWDAGIRV